MKPTTLARGLAALLVVASAAGCRTSATPHYYTLESTATAPGDAPAAHVGVLVGPVTVPASVDRPEFVVQVAPNRVEVDEFNRWAAPLSESIARTVAGDLSTLLGTADVATAPFANFTPTYRVTLNVQRFESQPGDAALIDAVWTLRKVSGGATRSGRTITREAVQGPGYEALAAAHSRALAKLSSSIADAIREAAGAP